MIKPIKHFAVNWIDGMKISQKHFNAQENFIIDTTRDATSLTLNKFNYGLLPTESKEREDIFQIYNTATDDVQIIIKNCIAVTTSGYRIKLSNYTASVKSLPSANKYSQKEQYIIIVINPFDKIAFGDLDPEEIPPRQPSTLPQYHVDSIPVSAIDKEYTGGNYLIIGKVNVENNTTKADELFIPPCTSIQSHPELKEYYDSFTEKLGKLQQYAFKIIKKAPNTHQNTAFTQNVKSLCTALINHSADTYFYFRNIIPEQAPVHMIEVLARQALHLYNAMQFIPSSELEEMLNYTYEWSQILPDTLKSQLSAVAEITYDHNNCASHLSDIETLLNSLDRIFSILTELDYIGQRKESIVVTEKDITPTAKIKEGWSVLD